MLRSIPVSGWTDDVSSPPLFASLARCIILSSSPPQRAPLETTIFFFTLEYSRLSRSYCPFPFFKFLTPQIDSCLLPFNSTLLLRRLFLQLPFFSCCSRLFLFHRRGSPPLPPPHFIDCLHPIVQPLEFGLQYIYVHSCVDTEGIGYLGNGCPDAVLGDIPLLVRSAHMDGVHIEATQKGVVGTSIVGHRQLSGFGTEWQYCLLSCWDAGLLVGNVETDSYIYTSYTPSRPFRL